MTFNPYDYAAGAHSSDAGVDLGAPAPSEADCDAATYSLATEFRSAFGKHPAGVAIVTTMRPAGPVGVLVSSIASVSAVPAVVSLSISDASNAGQGLLLSSDVAVHLLTAADAELARLFARRNREPADEAGVWAGEAEGVPLLKTHGAVLFGRIGLRQRAGSAVLLTVDVHEIRLPQGDHPGALVHYDRRWHQLPPLAP